MMFCMIVQCRLNTTINHVEKFASGHPLQIVREKRMTKNTKNDRRSLRTRQHIKIALVELLLEKQFVSITVQDILDRANVGRTTFYEHYLGKEDLLQSSLEDLLHALAHHAHENQSASLFFPSLDLFKHVKDQHRLYRAFV